MPGRTRSAQPTASPWNIVIASTCSACSASARTAGSDAASSPETISSPIGSGFSSSPSAAAAQASATPRPFGVAGRWKAAQPGLPSRPSRCASSASRAPPPPPRPDQIRIARSEARHALLELLAELGLGQPDDLGAVAARLLDPELDDRRAVRDLLLADHDDDLRVARSTRAARGTRRARTRSPRRSTAECAPSPWRSSLPSAYACSSVSEPESAVTMRPCAPRRSASARSSASSQESSLEAAAAHALERVDDPVVRVEVREGEAALVAQPALVDLGVVAREDPLDLALARRRADVAADRAEAADGGDVLDLPRPRLEAVLRRGERADRAELDHVAAERRAVALVLEGRDQRLGAAVPRDELPVLGDVGREARAAVAEDAALAVERDRRRDRDRLVERALRKRHPRLARAVLERQVLERALAALVADRAVERVVDEDELERRVLALGRLRGGLRRAHDHPVLRGQGAAGLELRDPLDLDEAHPAGADGRARAAARSRRPGSRSPPRRPSRRAPCPSRPRPRGRRRDRDRLGLGGAHAGTSATGWCVCWSTGASTFSSDDSPCIGQPPSRCSRNSARNLSM